jgi:hypothetical protein
VGAVKARTRLLAERGDKEIFKTSLADIVDATQNPQYLSSQDNCISST